MKDPRRLLDSEEGLAREILGLASRQPAPDALVTAVHRAVALALERQAEMDVSAQLPAQRARSVVVPSSRVRRAMRYWAKFGLALKASTLIPAGAALAAALGGSVIVGELFEPAPAVKLSARVESTSKPRPAPALTPSAAASRVPLEPPLTRDESSAALRDAPESLRPNAPARTRGSIQPLRARAVVPRGLGPERAPAAATTETAAFDEDWLGQQFALIGAARRHLDAGNPAEALQILDDYARRFPEGTLGQQAAALRQQLDAAASSASTRNGVDFGI